MDRRFNTVATCLLEDWAGAKPSAISLFVAGVRDPKASGEKDVVSGHAIRIIAGETYEEQILKHGPTVPHISDFKLEVTLNSANGKTSLTGYTRAIVSGNKMDNQLNVYDGQCSLATMIDSKGVSKIHFFTLKDPITGDQAIHFQN